MARVPGLRWILRDPPAPDISSPAPRDTFFEWARTLGPAAQVLEVGTKQSVAGVPTHSQARFPGVARDNYLMADVEEGADVDCVADVHDLPDDWANRFDAVVAIAVFEHLERPWIAAKEIRKVLKPGGRCYIATHQTYPIHGYPSDFFRFTKEALTLIFEDAQIEVLEVAYEHRTWIRLPNHLVPKRYGKAAYVDRWNGASPSYICVHLAGRKA